MPALTARDKQVLDFAGRHYRFTGKQEADMLTELDMSATAFWAKVHALIDRQEALAYAPTTVKRLQRLRDKGMRDRSAKLRGIAI